jgi:class 3 adenylate cyclase/alpha-beta hydrolase superfamily lysophospholipase
VPGPETHYARSGDVSIAYQVVGKGPPDLILIRGSLSELTTIWEQPLLVAFIDGLAAFSRLVLFDKRGMGLSDRLRDVPTLEARMDDVRAVLEAAGIDQAVLFAAHEGARLALLFAATYPERTSGIVLYDPSARGRRTEDYPWARSDAQWRVWLRDVADGWGSPEFFERYLAEYSPSVADDESFKRWFVRHMRQSASPGAAVAFQRMVMGGDVTDVLPTVAAPTLILCRQSSLGPAEYVASRLPDSVVTEIPGLVDGYSWATPEANEFVLGETKRFVRGLGEPVEPERALVTILFTDIVGSTNRAALLGDAEWKTVLAKHDSLVRRRLGQFRGREMNTTGDGFVASFDGPGRAIRCALSIAEDVSGLGLQIRAGLHTGEGEITDGSVGGIAVHIAARVVAEARAGEVLVSRTVKDLVAGAGFEFEERGRHVLKGVPEEWQLFSVRA